MSKPVKFRYFAHAMFLLWSSWPGHGAGSSKIKMCNLVDTDEAKKIPWWKKEEQRAPRSSFCPTHPTPMGVLDMTQRDSVCVCVCVFICLVVSDVDGLPEGPY